MKLVTASPDQVLDVIEAEKQQLMVQLVDAEVCFSNLYETKIAKWRKNKIK